MSKIEEFKKDKVKTSKKNAKAATVKKDKRKIDTEAKKLADQAIIGIAAALPGGQGNQFVQLHAEHQEAVKAMAAAGKWKRNVRAKMRTIKIDMACYDRVDKLSQMDPSDVLAKKATEALYEENLSLPLSEDQKKLISDIHVKRENARAAMSELNGGETGKEVGTGMIGHNSDADAENGEENANPAAQANVVAMPQRNESVGGEYRLHDAETVGGVQ